jgi:hypothetical protein
MLSIQLALPNGRLSRTRRDNAASSAAVCGWSTHATQSRRRATRSSVIGIASVAGSDICPPLLHGQSTQLSTIPARRGSWKGEEAEKVTAKYIID